MSLSTYVVGLVVVVGIGVPLWLAARLVRGWLLPSWSGAPARLAESVAFLALLCAIGQLLGSVGQLRRAPLVVLAIAAYVAVWAIPRRRAATDATDATDDQRSRERPRATIAGTTVVLLVLLSVAVLPWVAGTVSSLQHGVGGYDSVNYHLPIAARFAQSGKITPLIFVFPGYDTPFYPANSELVHAVGMVAFDRDILSPLVNLGWLGLALLSAWCAGRARRVPLGTLAAAVVLLAGPLFASSNGGRATNDIAGTALLLAGIAILLTGDGRRAATGLAAGACGLAVATKLTMVAPVVALTVCVIVAAGRGKRTATACAWMPWLLVTGAFWYVRNLFATGSIDPGVRIGIGSLALPSAHIQRPDPPNSVARFLLDVHVWRSAFLPGLRSAFGWAWPLTLLFVLVGCTLALRHHDRLLRAFGAAALLALVGYAFTPLSAEGGNSATRALFFSRNLRFTYPGVAIGLVLLPLVVSDTRKRVRLGWVALACVALVADLYYAVSGNRGLAIRAIAVMVVALAVGVMVVVVRSVVLSRSQLAALVAVAAVLTAGAGWVAQRSYLDRRYTNAGTLPFPSAPRGGVRLVYRLGSTVEDARIAVIGIGFQYPLFAADLSNRVEYVGVHGPHGAFDPATTCREWRRLLNAGDYDYVVVGANASGLPTPIEASWTRDDPAAHELLHDGTATVFRVRGAFDPSGC